MTLRLNGDSSGFTEIKAADAAGDNSIKLPASNGSANQLLQNGGTAGELQYTSAGGGLHYDSSGRLLAGTSTARANFFTSVDPQSQVEGTDVATSSLSLTCNSTNIGAVPVLLLGKSAGGSKNSNTLVANNHKLGQVDFLGNDGTVFKPGARIVGEVDGTPGTDVMPGKITFSTNGGGASVTPRVEIGSNGALKLLAGCPGIDFSARQGAPVAGSSFSETLDHYETGTFTPTLACFNGNTQLSTFAPILATYKGRYMRVGDRVFFTIYARYNTSAGEPATTTQIRIVGLPFVNGISSQQYDSIYVGYLSSLYTFSGTGAFPGGYIHDGRAELVLTTNAIGGSESKPTLSGNSNGGIMCGGSYSVNNY